MTRVILDFPSAGDRPAGSGEAPAATGPAARLVFGAPRRVLVADRATEVVPALRAAEAAAAAGAWVAGFIAYEAAPAFDRALATLPPAGPAPLLWLGVFDAPREAPPPAADAVAPLRWRTPTPRARYDDAIHEIRRRIAAGDVYQVNHTLRFEAPCAADALPLYDALVAPRHGLYHALIETDDWAVVSASPELFFDVRGRRITTRPMKGTLRRGRWLEEDRAAAARLAASPKDRAENLMIVDLLRNDLGRVARFGSVHVPAIFAVETYPTVHQMTSTVAAELRDDVAVCDVFAAMFPCGSVTGAPKIAAMKTIAQLEDAPRGPYCGAVGVMRPDGSATFNVAIRTLLLDRAMGRAVYGAGGGITWDSRAAAEYDEVVAKAALLSEPGADFELLETMRCDGGVVLRLDRHLQRLAASATYWGFPACTATSAADALSRFAAQHASGSRRLRLTAARTGEVRIASSPLEDPPGTAACDPRDTARIPTVALALRAVSRRDRMLFHKTTARLPYDTHRAEQPDAFDVLLFNGEGEVTEFTLGNVVADIDGDLLTPPRDCGLLAGALRQEMLDQGIVREAVITLEQARRATRLWHLNSVRGWTPVRLRG